MSKFISVVVASYNEEENIKRGVLEEMYAFMSKQDFTWEVIISDDGSVDGSKDLVKEKIKKLKGFRLLENPHGGKPSGLSYGIKAAEGENILITDMDQSTPISELTKLIPFLSEGYGVVIGSRGINRKNFPMYRKLGSAVFMGVRRALILPEIKDTQCGFKLFRADLLKKAFPMLEFFKTNEKVVGWKVTSFDVELLQILKKMGGKIKEVTVTWHDQDTSKSKGGGLSRYVNESVEMFSQILRVKINELRGLYN